MCSSKKYPYMPTPRKVDINSKGKGVFKRQKFLREV